MSPVETDGDAVPDTWIVTKPTTCKRDNCGNERPATRNYCSRDCWRADNPEVAL